MSPNMIAPNNRRSTVREASSERKSLSDIKTSCRHIASLAESLSIHANLAENASCDQNEI